MRYPCESDKTLEDDEVDRSEVEAQQCVELTDTNRSNSLTKRFWVGKIRMEEMNFCVWFEGIWDKNQEQKLLVFFCCLIQNFREICYSKKKRKGRGIW